MSNNENLLSGTVVAVSRSDKHTFSKQNCKSIKLVKGLGVEGDAHFGKTVKHRYQVAQDPSQPNLRQVHLVQAELFEELEEEFDVFPGDMGENITTRGINLLELPTYTLLHIGESAIVKITGLRNPCNQLNQLQAGLMNALVYKDEQGNLIRKAGVMGVVLEGGELRPDNEIRVELPPLPHRSLETV